MRYSICLLLCVIFFGCSNIKTIETPSPAIHKVKQGESFCIPLPENHTTGYLWQLSPSYNQETVDYINSVWHGNDKGVYFNFSAKAKGNCQLDFTLIKYHDTLEVKSFLIDVR